MANALSPVKLCEFTSRKVFGRSILYPSFYSCKEFVFPHDN